MVICLLTAGLAGFSSNCHTFLLASPLYCNQLLVSDFISLVWGIIHPVSVTPSAEHRGEIQFNQERQKICEGGDRVWGDWQHSRLDSSPCTTSESFYFLKGSKPSPGSLRSLNKALISMWFFFPLVICENDRFLLRDDSS